MHNTNIRTHIKRCTIEPRLERHLVLSVCCHEYIPISHRSRKWLSCSGLTISLVDSLNCTTDNTEEQIQLPIHQDYTKSRARIEGWSLYVANPCAWYTLLGTFFNIFVIIYKCNSNFCFGGGGETMKRVTYVPFFLMGNNQILGWRPPPPKKEPLGNPDISCSPLIFYEYLFHRWCITGTTGTDKLLLLGLTLNNLFVLFYIA